MNQLHIGLQGNMQFGQDVLAKCGIADDFGKIVAHIIDQGTRRQHLNLGDFSNQARGYLEDFTNEKAYLKFVDQDFIQVLNAFIERPPEQWSRYEIFEKTFLVKDTAPQDAPSSGGDTKMSEPTSA